MSGYPTSMSLPQVDGLSTDPWVLWFHSLVSKHRYTNMGIGLGHVVII